MYAVVNFAVNLFQIGQNMFKLVKSFPNWSTFTYAAGIELKVHQFSLFDLLLRILIYCIHFQVSNSKTRKSKQKSNSEDVRSCQFCGELGDKGQGGRLLHFRHNEWVHVNCALWSSEVYEEVDGSLQNVGQALTRGLKLNCTLCSKKGASIGKNTTFQDFLCLFELV